MTTFFMSIYPEVQDKVIEEIKHVMGNREDVEYDDVQKMKYLVSGIPVKEGTIIEVPIRFLHFDPEVFPEPGKFKPERFLKENFQDSDVQGYMTFGEGHKRYSGPSNSEDRIAHLEFGAQGWITWDRSTSTFRNRSR